MIAPLFALLLAGLPAQAYADDLPDSEIRSQAKIPWRDPRYHSDIWLYLQQLDPLLQGRWIGLEPREQSRLLTLAAQRASVTGATLTPNGFPPPMIGLADRLVFDDPEQRQLSEYWNRYFTDNFQNNPVGRSILEHLKEGLPPMKIAHLSPHAIADFSPAAVFIQVNSILLRREIESLDSSANLADNPKDLTAYLLSHPSITQDVFKSYRSVEAHEATHAVQNAAFRDDLLPNSQQADYIEAEKHAFTVQHLYTLAELESDSQFLASQSPIVREARASLTDCLSDYDRCMANIGIAYTQAHELSWAIAGTGKSESSDMRILDRMKGFYEDFSQRTRQDWTEKNSKGLLSLAERLAAPNPDEAMHDLQMLEYLMPTQVRDQGELASRFAQAADRAMAADAVALRTGEPSVEKVLELDLASRHLGRPFPTDLTGVRDSSYRSEIIRLRGLPDLTSNLAQRGLYMSRVMKDADAERFFASKQ